MGWTWNTQQADRPYSKVTNWPATVDNTATGQYLVGGTSLKGSALAAATDFIMVAPEWASGDVRWALGSASASSGKLRAEGETFTSAEAASVRLFADPDAAVAVVEYKYD